MIKGIIFDLDGTLLDTIEDIKDAVNEVMRKYDLLEYDADQIRQKVGNGNKKLIERCLPEDKKYLLDEALNEFLKSYRGCFRNKSEPFKGIKETLKIIQDKGVLISVNTNKQNMFCEELMECKLSEIDFIRIIGSRDNIPNKPDPYSCNEIIKDMNLNLDEVVYVGDSGVDIETGKNAGIKTVWVSWGTRKYDDIKDLKPDYIINNPKELLDIIEA